MYTFQVLAHWACTIHYVWGLEHCFSNTALWYCGWGSCYICLYGSKRSKREAGRVAIIVHTSCMYGAFPHKLIDNHKLPLFPLVLTPSYDDTYGHLLQDVGFIILAHTVQRQSVYHNYFITHSLSAAGTDMYKHKVDAQLRCTTFQYL